MPKRRRDPDDFDSPWKDALHAYLPSFLEFFFLDIHADIDWKRGYVALDKEFQQIVRRAKTGKRLADKLFKVWLRDGGERWLLIHVEVQGEPEEAFPERMFNYNVAAWRLYNQTVVGLAVLCDDRPGWRPTSFGYGQWGCRTETTFRVVKLLDYAQDLEGLARHSNRFAAVILAHCQALRTRRDAAGRQVEKLRLVKSLYEHGWPKEDVRQLFRLIDWIMTLPEDLEEAFRADVFAYEQEKKMPYLSSIERSALKKGLEQGRQEGLEQGEERGLLLGINVALAAKFGPQGRKLMGKVRALGDLARLRHFARFLETAKSLDDVRAFLS